MINAIYRQSFPVVDGCDASASLRPTPQQCRVIPRPSTKTNGSAITIDRAIQIPLRPTGCGIVFGTVLFETEYPIQSRPLFAPADAGSADTRTRLKPIGFIRPARQDKTT